MNLLEILNMFKVYIKKIKKSISPALNFEPGKIDIFLMLVLLIAVISPFLTYLNFSRKPNIREITLYLSPRFGELLGTEITEKLLQDFSGLYPDIQLLVLPADSEGEPDVIIFGEGDYSALVASGKLADLNAIIVHESFNDWFFLEDVNAQRTRRHFALPLASFMDLLFYNIDILTAAGFDRPPKTREEFLVYARAVSNSSVPRLVLASGAAMGLSPLDRQAVSRDIFSWIWAAGGNFWQGGAAQLSARPVLDSRDITRDITFLGSLYNEGVLARDTFTTTGDQRLTDFARGRIAMMIASSGSIPYLRERMGDDAFGITNIPGSDLTGMYNISLSGIYAGINANSGNRHEAGVFIAFLADQRQAINEALKAVPGVVSDVIPGDYIVNDPFYSKAQDIFTTANIIEGFSKTPGAEEFETAFLEEMRIYFEGGQTVQQAVTAIQRRWSR